MTQRATQRQIGLLRALYAANRLPFATPRSKADAEAMIATLGASAKAGSRRAPSPPSPRQVQRLRELCADRRETFVMPRSAAEANAWIRRFKAAGARPAPTDRLADLTSVGPRTDAGRPQT